MVAAIALYLFVGHMMTAQEALHPAWRFSRTAISCRRTDPDVGDGPGAAGLVGAARRPICRTSAGVQRDPDRVPDGAARPGRDGGDDLRRAAGR